MTATICGMSNDWPIPDDLSLEGRKAAEVIRDFFNKKDIAQHGGGGKFYSPQQWQDRDELYGLNSVLIITHDGGDHAGAFNLDYEQYELHDNLQEELRPLGMFLEACTSWYSAVHPL